MTSAERAALETGLEVVGGVEVPYGFFIPAGTRVAMRGPATGGRWVWYYTRKPILTGRGDKPTNEDHPIHTGMTCENGYDIGTVTVGAYEVRYVRQADYPAPGCPVQDWTFRDHPCLCGGKGEVERGYYGRRAGTSWIEKCGERCTYRPKARRVVRPAVAAG